MRNKTQGINFDNNVEIFYFISIVGCKEYIESLLPDLKKIIKFSVILLSKFHTIATNFQVYCNWSKWHLKEFLLRKRKYEHNLVSSRLYKRADCDI
jgi:hypothetical protein